MDVPERELHVSLAFWCCHGARDECVMMDALEIRLMSVRSIPKFCNSLVSSLSTPAPCFPPACQIVNIQPCMQQSRCQLEFFVITWNLTSEMIWAIRKLDCFSTFWKNVTKIKSSWHHQLWVVMCAKTDHLFCTNQSLPQHQPKSPVHCHKERQSQWQLPADGASLTTKS